MSETLKVSDVAVMLRMSVKTVRAAARDGRIPGFKLKEGAKAHWRFEERVIRSLMNGKGVNGASEEG